MQRSPGSSVLEHGSELPSFLKFLFIHYFWLCRGFTAVQGLLSRCGVQASHFGGPPWCRGWAPVCEDFGSCSSRALAPRSNSCGAWANLLLGMWDLSRSGIKPVAPALAGGFFTTEPLGKPQNFLPFKDSLMTSGLPGASPNPEQG